MAVYVLNTQYQKKKKKSALKWGNQNLLIITDGIFCFTISKQITKKHLFYLCRHNIMKANAIQECDSIRKSPNKKLYQNVITFHQLRHFD